MDVEQLADELSALGLEEPEARLYLGLLQTGPAKAAKLRPFFEGSRSSLYRLLDDLVERGLVTKSLTTPTVFEAVEPEELFALVGAELRRSRDRLERVRERCEPELQALAQTSAEPSRQHRWRRVEGREAVYGTFHAMVEAAEERIWCASNDPVTFEAHLPVVEEAWEVVGRRVREDGVEARLLLAIGDHPDEALPSWVAKEPQAEPCPLDAEAMIHFVLVDEAELLSWVRSAPPGASEEVDDVAVFTDAPQSVAVHRLLFERLWAEAAGIAGEPA